MSWQPIETAPKDGRVIVIRHNLGTWIHDQDNVCCVCVHWRGDRWQEFGPDSFEEWQVTHWLPLPEPPK